MKGKKLLLFLFAGAITVLSINWAIGDSKPTERERRALLDTRIDNNKYWIEKSKLGLTVLNPEVRVPEAIYTGSKIKAATVITDDSPDVPVIDVNSSTQSENSIFVDPSTNEIALNSNNSTSVGGPPSYGANYLYTFDIGETWDGSKNGAGGNNDGDPAACIGTDGRWYVNMISNMGQAVSYSDDKGQSWTKVQIAPNPGQVADKNHMWIDSKVGSPNENNLYCAWTDFGGGYDGHVVVSHSSDNGENWSNKQALSYGVSAGGHNQGVNISTGPNGEAYAIWAVYDGGALDEDAIGFAKSLDGGETWETSYRIIDNIRGIRAQGVPQNQRVNSFPSMTVDISSGENSGNIYVVWANIGVPGINSGTGSDVYMIKSTDEGETWSDPIKVNQDEIGQGKTHYFPWITCDPSNGMLSVIFYDNRNTTSTQAEAWVANSSDTGDSWEDFKVSDVSFTPSPIPGMASGYFGDYLSIAALDGKVYPCWTDNRSGHAMTYVSVFETIVISSPFNLQTSVDQNTGDVNLSWDFNPGTGFQNFRVYRNDVLIEETTEMNYSETLIDYGYYNYKITAFFGGSNESGGPDEDIQFGSPTMMVTPGEYVANVKPEDIEIQEMVIKNNGVLDLDFSLSPFFPSTNAQFIAPAIGGGDEFINIFELGDFENRSSSNGYYFYKEQTIFMESNKAYEIKVHTLNAYAEDVCYVWIDSNGDGEFNEPHIVLQSNEDNSLFYGLLDFEKGSVLGIINMRIRLSANENMNAYDDTKYGETEDYLLFVASWLGIDPDEGIIAPGDSLIVELAFDAAGMEIGSYTDNIRFVTNDLENPIYSIPVTMNVTDLELEVTADPADICVGEETTLMAITTGGSGTYSYSWTSIPEGFTSDEQSPMVSPLENTQYFVAVDDGIITLDDYVDVVVFDVPIVNLIDLVECEGNSVLLDAGNPGAEYLWSTDETTQTIVVSGEGINQYWVIVTNENNCSTADTANITFYENPQVDLGADTIICQNQSIILDAGYSGSSYLWSTGETTQTIVVDTTNYEIGDHNFSVSVITPLSCEGNDEIKVKLLDCTGISESKATVSIVAYPNPSSGIINLKLESVNNEIIDVKISSINGNVIYFEKAISVNKSLNKQIDLRNFANGVYTLFVIGENYIVDEKIILQQ